MGAAGTSPGGNAGGGAISNLTDVSVKGQVNGNSLVWNTVCGCWTNGSPSATATNAVATINGDGTTAQVITSGTTGANVGVSSSGGTTTINIPTADATHTGKLLNTDWSTFGAKATLSDATNAATGVIAQSNAYTGNLTLQGWKIFTRLSQSDGGITNYDIFINSLGPSLGPLGGSGIVYITNNLGHMLGIQAGGMFTCYDGNFTNRSSIFNQTGQKGTLSIGGSNSVLNFNVNGVYQLQINSSGQINDANSVTIYDPATGRFFGDGSQLTGITSGGGGAGSLPANANQFNTNGTITIKSGVVLTNPAIYGITASRAAVIDANNNVTNATGTADATHYLDGTGAYSIPSGGTATPGGSFPQLQFNNSGALAGTTNLTWDQTNSTLSLNGTVTAVTMTVGTNISAGIRLPGTPNTNANPLGLILLNGTFTTWSTNSTTNLVVEVNTNAYGATVTNYASGTANNVSNWVNSVSNRLDAFSVANTNNANARQGGQAALTNIAGLSSTVFTNVPLGGSNINVRTTAGTNFIDLKGDTMTGNTTGNAAGATNYYGAALTNLPDANIGIEFVTNSVEFIAGQTNIWNATSGTNVVVNADKGSVLIFCTNTFALTNFINLETTWGTVEKNFRVHILGCSNSPSIVILPNWNSVSYNGMYFKTNANQGILAGAGNTNLWVTNNIHYDLVFTSLGTNGQVIITAW